MKKSNVSKNNTEALYVAIRQLVYDSKGAIAISVNQQLSLLYWNIGKCIKKEVLQNKRADYGKQIIGTLSQKLTTEFGKGWSKQQLWNCLYTVEIFPSKKIISTLSGELSWSHLKEIIYIKAPLQREFYIQFCRNEKWSVRQLRERIDSMLYERTALSKKPGKLVQEELRAFKNKETVSPDIYFRDPYLLDFLGLKDTFSEKDLETAIIAELQRFIVELGSDFAFLARQKRIQIDNEDYYIDLLFYHRQLQRLVVIDLKLGKFKTAYKAQMELYLNWLNKYERNMHEQPPIGLILCAGKSDEHIELLELDKGNIRVSEYYTNLPSKKVLQQKLHKAVLMAQAKMKGNK
jgi:predicted nuclease of restriction endonuclease-like (RecB) superfamily